jgi:hypothetical protein
MNWSGAHFLNVAAPEDGLRSLLQRRDRVRFRGAPQLDGPGSLRFLVSGKDGPALVAAVLEGATRRLGRRVSHLRELGKETVLVLAPEEQYLVATGGTYFRDLSFDDLYRMQFDLETTGLNPERDRIFIIAVGHPSGATEASSRGNDGEATLIRRPFLEYLAASDLSSACDTLGL